MFTALEDNTKNNYYGKTQSPQKLTLLSKNKKCKRDLEILFQRLGKKHYAFTIKEGEVYWSEITA